MNVNLLKKGIINILKRAIAKDEFEVYYQPIYSLKKNEYQKLLIIVLSVWCFIPTIFGLFYNSSEMFFFYNRLIWLIMMYFVGAYIRIYSIKIFDSKKRCLITSVITFFIMFLSII